MSESSTLAAADVLAVLGWLPDGRHVASAAIAGAGNMNLVERVTFDDGSTLILKRARGWVEKYPDIPAPIERAEVEAEFYATVAGTAAGTAMPQHLGFDKSQAANLFEDLGEASDGMTAYSGQLIGDDALDALADWLHQLHNLKTPANARLANPKMRALNAIHIFDYPLDPGNGFDLDSITPGLQAVADRLKHDGEFVAAVRRVSERYLGDGPGVLLHGDLYPGSWLTTPNGLFLIDPEFCWIGPREWDVGVLIAHLRLSGQPEASTERLITRYNDALDQALMNKVCGIEIMRRLIGVAQLPLTLDLAAKTALLDEARTLVLASTI
ncbi:5-methylthioribose kinase [Blastomonas natatoria]|uniref:5-methylthioribose kinase n=1 Tax=Blastomonas natatoria TaxID=34015 RepID=A0A2V3V8T1_9SPHN|nr:phosphotransferase [Blastomonas natatoria]PXW78196.1 5-methylthioribose kinase [Blastomonas natatoria]